MTVRVLWALSLGVLGLALGVTYLRLRSHSLDASIFFNSDLLYLPALFRDVFEEGGRWRGWRLTPAPYFLPDMALFFALNAALDNFVAAVRAYAPIQMALVALAAQGLARTLAPPDRRVAAALVLVASAALVLLFARGQFPLLIYAFTSGIHTGALIATLIALALTFHVLGPSPSRLRTTQVLLAALCFFAALSDGLFFVVFVAPVVVTLGLLTWKRAAATRQLNVPAAIVVTASVAGYLATRVVTAGTAGAKHMTLRLNAALESLRRLGSAADMMAREELPIVAFLWVVALAWGIRCAVRFLRAPKGAAIDRIDVLWAFILLLIGSNVAAVALTGQFQDRTGFRYLMVPILMPLFALALLPLRLRSPLVALKTAAASCALVGGAWIAFTIGDARAGCLGGPGEAYPPLVACLDAHRDRYRLERGLSDYWKAKEVWMFSRTGLRVVQLTQDGKPYHWINNADWYEERRPGASAYNFILPSGLDVSALRERYGEPSSTFECPGSAVWVYEEDALDSRARAGFARKR